MTFYNLRPLFGRNGRRKVTAQLASDNGVSLDDLIWVAARLGRRNRDIRRKLAAFTLECARLSQPRKRPDYWPSVEAACEAAVAGKRNARALLRYARVVARGAFTRGDIAAYDAVTAAIGSLPRQTGEGLYSTTTRLEYAAKSAANLALGGARRQAQARGWLMARLVALLS